MLVEPFVAAGSWAIPKPKFVQKVRVAAYCSLSKTRGFPTNRASVYLTTDEAEKGPIRENAYTRSQPLKPTYNGSEPFCA